MQTNGMLVTQDGYLVIKQWSYILEDILLLVSARDQLGRLLIALFVVISSIYYMRLNKSFHIYDTKFVKVKTVLPSLLFGAAVAIIIWISIFMGTFKYLLGSYDPVRYIAESVLFNGGGGGEVKFIDPISLEVVAEAWYPERASYGRMTMSNLVNSRGS